MESVSQRCCEGIMKIKKVGDYLSVEGDRGTGVMTRLKLVQEV